MDNEHIHELWTRHLAGETLSPSDEAALSAALHADPDLRRQLLADERTDGALHAIARGHNDAAAFAQSVADRLAAEETGRKFVSGVRRKVQAETGKLQAANQGADKILTVHAAPRRWPVLPLAAAAVLALIAGIGLYQYYRPGTLPVENGGANSSVAHNTTSPAQPGDALGKLIKVDGVAHAIRDKVKVPVATGEPVVAGMGLETGGASTATFEFKDGSRIEASINTRIDQIDNDGGEKRITLATGGLRAVVAQQKTPLILKTPTAEVRVLGTIFNVVSDFDSLRLDVHEGKVRVTRLSDRASLDLTEGQFTVVREGVALAVQRWRIRTRSGTVDSIDFSPDGRWLLAGCYDNRARLWDLQSSEPHREFGDHGERVRVVAFAPDGRQFATGSWDKTTRIWELETGKALQVLKTVGRVWSLSYSADGKTLFTGDFSRILKTWNAQTGAELRSMDPRVSEILALDYSGQGELLAMGGTASMVRVFDSTKMMEKWSQKVETVVSCVQFSPDDSLLASTHGDIVQLWNAVTGAKVRAFSGHENRTRCVRFSTDGKTLISTSDDKTVRLWDVASGAPLATLTGHTLPVNALAVSPDGDLFVSGSDDGDIRFWRLSDHK